MSNTYPTVPNDGGAVTSGSRRTFQVDMDAVIAQNAPSPMQQRALARSATNADHGDVLQTSFHSLTYEDVQAPDDHPHVLTTAGTGPRAFIASIIPRTTRGPGGQTYIYCGNPRRFWRCVLAVVALTALVATVHHVGNKPSNAAAPAEPTVNVPPPQEPIINDQPPTEDQPTGEEQTESPPEDIAPPDEEVADMDDDAYDDDQEGEQAAFGTDDGEDDEDDEEEEEDDDEQCATFNETTQDVDPFLQCYCNDGASLTNAWTTPVMEMRAFLTSSMPDVVPEFNEGLMANSCHPQNMALFWMARDMVLNDVVDTTDGARVQQRYILAYLYGQWGGDDWNYYDNWLDETTECEWQGVECNEVNQVVAIHLADNNLEGNIPSHLGHLEGLRSLVLANNELSGSLPGEFFILTNLVKLDLNNNYISGDLPEAISLMTNLETLALKSNNITGTIPAKFGALSNLLEFHMEDNQLEGQLPTEIFRLKKLSSLSLSENYDITGVVPVEIDFLQSLTDLSMHHMGLTGTLPATIGLVKSLESLRLDSNQFQGTIPPVYGDLSSLTYFNLEGNQLTGEIPTEFGYLSRIELMSLSGNEGIEGTIPKELARMTNLVSAHLSDLPKLSGNIPFCIEGFEPDFLVVDCSPQLTCECCTSQDNTDCDYA